MNRYPETIASLRDASKRYGKQLALDQVDLELRRGEVLALLGPNGAGKTTAIALMLGIARPDNGEATLFGAAPGSLDARRRIGVMLQTDGVPGTLNVLELITLFRSYYPRPRSVADIVALAGVGSLLKHYYASLSGGQQRRVQFALAIVGNPQALFLDEPTTGLDIEARETVWATIRQLVSEGCALLLTTHYLEEAEALADRISVLMHGRLIADGSLEEIRARVSGKQIRCISALSETVVAGWSDVRAARRKGEWLEIVTAQPEPVLRQLLFEDTQVRELEVRRAGLAEAFVEITKEAA